MTILQKDNAVLRDSGEDDCEVMYFSLAKEHSVSRAVGRAEEPAIIANLASRRCHPTVPRLGYSLRPGPEQNNRAAETTSTAKLASTIGRVRHNLTLKVLPCPVSRRTAAKTARPDCHRAHEFPFGQIFLLTGGLAHVWLEVEDFGQRAADQLLGLPNGIILPGPGSPEESSDLSIIRLLIPFLANAAIRFIAPTLRTAPRGRNTIPTSVRNSFPAEHARPQHLTSAEASHGA